MRYELSDYEWAAIKPMLPNKPRGVRRVNDRRVLNGIFWVLRSGAPGAICRKPMVPVPLAITAWFGGGGPASGTRSWMRWLPVAMCQNPEVRRSYSITSSARASSAGGASRPSALAVLRLITRSSRVGCSTGKSPGFAPSRIFLTK